MNLHGLSVSDLAELLHLVACRLDGCCCHDEHVHISSTLPSSSVNLILMRNSSRLMNWLLQPGLAVGPNWVRKSFLEASWTSIASLCISDTSHCFDSYGSRFAESADPFGTMTDRVYVSPLQRMMCLH
jgi:hypothetical protein